MLPRPDPHTQGLYGLVSPQHPLHPSLFLPSGSQGSPMYSSATPSSTEAGPNAPKRARTVSISQRTDDDDGDTQDGRKKKAKGKAKSSSVDVKEDDKEEKGQNRTGKACLNCRRQKMKCEGGDNPPCARCKASGTDCIFKPRANAAILVDDAHWQEMVERRLGSLEIDMRTMRQRGPTSPTRSSFGANASHAGPSRSSFGQSPSSMYDQQQSVTFKSAPEPSPSQPSFSSGTNASGTIDSPLSATNPFFASMPPPSRGSGQSYRGQTTERFRSMSETLGRTLEGLQDCRTGIYGVGSEVDMTALTFEAVIECWDHFHASILPLLWSYPLPPSPRPSKLLLAAILATATLLHPSPQISALHLQTSHLLELALSDLVLAPLRIAEASAAKTEQIPQYGELDDIVGLCIAVTWLICPAGTCAGSGGEVLTGLAWRLATDKCLRGGQVGEESRKRVWDLVQITELLHCSLALSRPLLPVTPPPDLPTTSTFATPSLFQAMSAASKLMHGLISAFSVRSFPSVLALIAAKERGNEVPRQDALGYQDEAVVKRYKAEADEWAKKWLGVIASSNLGTSAFAAAPDPSALNFLVLIYHSCILLGSTLQRCRPAGPTAEDDASMLASSKALLQVLSTNAEFGNKAGAMPVALLMYFKLASLIIIEAVSSARTSHDDLLLPRTLLTSLQSHSPPPSTPQHALLTSLATALSSPHLATLPVSAPTSSFDTDAMFPPPSSLSVSQDQPPPTNQILDSQTQNDFFASVLTSSGDTIPEEMGTLGLSRVGSPFTFEPGVFDGDGEFPTYLHTNFSSGVGIGSGGEGGYGAGGGTTTSWPPSWLPGARSWGGGGGGGV